VRTEREAVARVRDLLRAGIQDALPDTV
jgi:hypothetical protein